MISNLKTILRLILTTKNWLVIFINVFILKKDAKAIFKSGYTLLVHPRKLNIFNSFTSFFRHFPEGKITGSVVTISYKSKKLSFDFGNTAPGALSEFFGENFPYKIRFNLLEIKDRVVVDIGAYFGDSTIWFAAHNAKKVYAFEPLTTYYKLCERNIELNGLSDICEVVQAAIAGKAEDDFFEVEAGKRILGMGAGLYSERTNNIPIFTLDEVTKTRNIKNNAFLKMDCEGYEYDIILNSSDETLKLFDIIMMEYHYGYEKLENRFKKIGFSVKHTSPQFGYQAESGDEFKKMSVGYILARK